MEKLSITEGLRRSVGFKLNNRKHLTLTTTYGMLIVGGLNMYDLVTEMNFAERELRGNGRRGRRHHRMYVLDRIRYDIERMEDKARRRAQKDKDSF